MFSRRTWAALLPVAGVLCVSGCHPSEDANRMIGRQLPVVDALFDRDYRRLESLAAAADLSQTTTIGRDALDYAVGEGDLRAVEILLRVGAKPNRQGGAALCRAASRPGNSPVVRALLKAGADPNLPPRVSYNWSALPLTAAAESGDEQNVEVLLQAGARWRDVPPHGHSALYNAATVGQASLVKRFLELGANPNQQSATGQTSLFAATVRYRGRPRQPEAMDLLLRHGARVDSRDGQGRTPLLDGAAAYHPFGSPEAMRALLEAGAEVNAVDQKGRNALQIAVECYYGDPMPEIVALLLHAGVDTHRRDELGDTPYQHFAKVLAAQQEQQSFDLWTMLFPPHWMEEREQRQRLVLEHLRQATQIPAC